jgi:hypothetical protein
VVSYLPNFSMYEEESNHAIQKITPIGDDHSKDFQGFLTSLKLRKSNEDDEEDLYENDGYFEYYWGILAFSNVT